MNADTKRYVGILTFGKNIVHLQSFPEGINQGKPDQKLGHIDDLALWVESELASGKSVFCTVNETDGLGRKSQNIIKVRALFADYDDITKDNFEIIKQLKPRPHLVVATSQGKYHVYWLVHDCPIGQFKGFQQAISRKLDTDPSVCDLGRVMRLPGTYNRKHEPYLVKLEDLWNNGPTPPPYSVEKVMRGLDIQLPNPESNTISPPTNHLPSLKSDDTVLKEIELTQHKLTSGKASAYDLFHENTEALSNSYPDKTGKNLYNHSSADIALCCHLAKMTNFDHHQIDRIFRSSRLYRDDKWNREDYRNTTIQKAINRVSKNTDNEITINIRNFNQEPTNHVPLKCFEVPRGVSGNGNHVENAIFMLSNVFNSRLKKYEDKFLWWTGRQYEIVSISTVRCKVGLAISGVGKASQNNINSQTQTIFDHADELKDIDPPANKIFYQNGVFDLDTKMFESHNSSNKNTRTLNVSYNPSALAPEFIRWQKDIFSSHPDQIQFVEELLGYLMFRGNMGIEKAFLLMGPPRAGKGTLAWLIKHLIGDAAAAFNLSELHDGKEVNQLRHAQVAIDAEAVGPDKRHIRVVVSRFKSITANDFFTSPIIYKSVTWNGPANCKLIAMANSIPYLPDHSGAATNRWIVVVFDQTFLGREDPNLKNRLLKELEGIAMLGLRGLLRLQKRGEFKVPTVSSDMLENMSNVSGGVHDFVSSQCSLGKEFRISERDIFNAYTRWCQSEGHNKLNRPLFMNALEDATRGNGVLRKASLRIPGKSSPDRGFIGITLNPAKVEQGSFHDRITAPHFNPSTPPRPAPSPPPPPPLKH